MGGGKGLIDAVLYSDEQKSSMQFAHKPSSSDTSQRVYADLADFCSAADPLRPIINFFTLLA